jgi:hypothetical protein
VGVVCSDDCQMVEMAAEDVRAQPSIS